MKPLFELHSVFDLLEAMRHYTSLFTAAGDEHRGDQLRELEKILQGYTIAVHAHCLQEPVANFPQAFALYLSAKYDWSGACGAVAAVRNAAGNDRDAWDLYWKLVDEFKQTIVKAN